MVGPNMRLLELLLRLLRLLRHKMLHCVSWPLQLVHGGILSVDVLRMCGRIVGRRVGQRTRLAYDKRAVGRSRPYAVSGLPILRLAWHHLLPVLVHGDVDRYNDTFGVLSCTLGWCS